MSNGFRDKEVLDTIACLLPPKGVLTIYLLEGNDFGCGQRAITKALRY